MIERNIDNIKKYMERNIDDKKIREYSTLIYIDLQEVRGIKTRNVLFLNQI